MKRVACGWVGDDVRTIADLRRLEGMLPSGVTLSEVHVLVSGAPPPDPAGLREAASGRLALHLDLSSHEAHTTGDLPHPPSAPESVEDLGVYVLEFARALARVPGAVRASCLRQAQVFGELFGAPTSVSVHHYLDQVSPLIAACADEVAGIWRRPRRGWVVPVSRLLGASHTGVGRPAVHAAGYPDRGAWRDADEALPDEPCDIIVHGEDDPLALITLWRRIRDVG